MANQNNQQGRISILDVPSPCQNICILDPEMVCIGCGRTADEVAGWTQMSNQEKQAVIDRLSEEGWL